jgi:hypothetical protein
MAKRHHEARFFEIDWKTLLQEEGVIDRSSFHAGWLLGSITMALRNDVDIDDQCIPVRNDLEVRQLDLIAMAFGRVLVTKADEDGKGHVHVRRPESRTIPNDPR